VAEELLRAEGSRTSGTSRKRACRNPQSGGVWRGAITVGSLGPVLIQIDEGDPLVLLAGVHVGCFVLFATESVRTIRDLKGRPWA